MDFVLKHRFLIIGVAILVSLFFGLNMTKITRDAGISALLPEDDPDYQFARETVKTFGAWDQILVGIAIHLNTLLTLDF